MENGQVCPIEAKFSPFVYFQFLPIAGSYADSWEWLDTIVGFVQVLHLWLSFSIKVPFDWTIISQQACDGAKVLLGYRMGVEQGCPILFLEIYLPTCLAGSVVFDQGWSWTLQEGRSPEAILGTPGLQHPQTPYKILASLIPSLKTVHDSTMIEIQPTTVPDRFNQISARHTRHFKMERPTFKNKFNTVNKHTGRHFELLFNTWTQSELY